MEEDKKFSNRVEDSRFKKTSRRSSSILKTTTPKYPLADLDPNRQAELCTSKKITRKSLSRRVSFADTYEVKVFLKPDESSDGHHDPSLDQSSTKENEPETARGDLTASGLDKLLKGPIQDPQLYDNEDNVSEHPLPDTAPTVPYDAVNQTIYDNHAMEMTQIDNSLQESVPDDFGEADMIDKRKAVNFLQNLFSKPEYATLGEGSQSVSDDKPETNRCDREVNFYTSNYVPQQTRSEDIAGRQEPVMVRGLSGRSPLMCIQAFEQDDVTETDLTDYESPQKVADHKSFLNRLKSGGMASSMITGREDVKAVDKAIDKTVIFGQEGDNDMDHTEPIKGIAIEVNDSVSRTHTSTRNLDNHTKIFHSNNDMEQTLIPTTSFAPNEYRTATASEDGQFTKYYDRNQTMEITTNFTSKIRITDTKDLNLTAGGPNKAGDLTTGLTGDIGKFNMNKTVAFDNDDMEQTRLVSEIKDSQSEGLNVEGNRSTSGIIANVRTSISNIGTGERRPIMQGISSIGDNTKKTTIFSGDNMEETRMLTSGVVIDRDHFDRTTALNDNMEETRILTSGVVIDRDQFSKTTALNDNMEETRMLTSGVVIDRGQFNRTTALNDNMEETRMLTSGVVIDRDQFSKTTALNDNMEETRIATSGVVIDRSQVNKTMTFNDNMEETRMLTNGNNERDKFDKTTTLNDNMEETRIATSGVVIDRSKVNKTMTFNDNMEETRMLTSGDINRDLCNKTTTLNDNMEETGIVASGIVIDSNQVNKTMTFSDMEETRMLSSRDVIGRDQTNKTMTYNDNMEETRMLTSGLVKSMEETRPLTSCFNFAEDNVNNKGLPADVSIVRDEGSVNVGFTSTEICEDDNIAEKRLSARRKSFANKDFNVTTYTDNMDETLPVSSTGKSVATKDVTMTTYSSKMEEIAPVDMVTKSSTTRLVDNKTVSCNADNMEETRILIDETVSVANVNDAISANQNCQMAKVMEPSNKEVHSVSSEQSRNQFDQSLNTTNLMGPADDAMEKTALVSNGRSVLDENKTTTNFLSDKSGITSRFESENEPTEVIKAKYAKFLMDMKKNRIEMAGPDDDFPDLDFDDDEDLHMRTRDGTCNVTMKTGKKRRSTVKLSTTAKMPYLMKEEEKEETERSKEDVNERPEIDGNRNEENKPVEGGLDTVTPDEITEIGSISGLLNFDNSQLLSAVSIQQNTADIEQLTNSANYRHNIAVTNQEGNRLGNQLNNTLDSQHMCNYTTRSSSSEESQLQETAQSLMASMSTNMIKIIDDWEEEEEEFDGPMTIENFCTKFLKVPLPCQFWRNSNKRRRSSIASAPMEIECEDTWSKLEMSVIHGSYIEACQNLLQEAVATADCRAREREKLEERFLSDPPDWVKEAQGGLSEEGKLQIKEKVAELSSMCNSIARKLHYKEIKHQASTAYCNILKSKLAELNSNVELTSELLLKAKGILDTLNEEEARLDDILSVSMNEAEVNMEEVSSEIEENTKKIDELARIEEELKRELEELEHRANESENKLSKLRQESLDKEEQSREYITEKEDLQADINTLENLTEWIWHHSQSDDEVEVFLFYDATLAVLVDKIPGPINGDIKIRKIRIHSLLEDDDEGMQSIIDLMKMAKVKMGHNLLLKTIDTQNLCEKYKSLDALPELLHELSTVVIDMKTLMSDLDRAGLLDNVLLTWNAKDSCATYEKWSMTQLRKVVITLKLTVEDHSVKTVPHVCVKCGKMRTEDVMNLIQRVEPGANYIERLLQAINLEDVDSSPDLVT